MKIVNALLLFFSFYFCFVVVKVAGLFIPRAKAAKNPKKILFLSAFFPENAGYIYREQKWAEIFRENGFEVEIKNTLDKDRFYKYLETNDVRFHLTNLFKRVWQVLMSGRYDVVIVRRDLLLFNDYGNLFLEKLLLKIHPNAMLDFDDDISFAKNEPREITSSFGKLMLEDGTKFENSLRLYRKFVAGSNYLKELVLSKNAQAVERDICVVPTCVDYESHPQKIYKSENDKPLVFGWIGSNGNLWLLEKIIPQLNELHKHFPLKLLVISGKNVVYDVDFEIENRMWSYETQIDDLRDIDVGLMPLDNTREDKGKCGFKLIQYMGLGIVSIAGAITVNAEIIDDEKNGFLVSPDNDWSRELLKVVKSRGEFEEIGDAARRKIFENYSFAANKEKYIDFIKNTAKS